MSNPYGQVYDEVTGQTYTLQDPNTFTHMLISDEGQIPGVCAGSAIMIGTRGNCMRYQLQHGLRAKTQIIDF